MNTLHDKLLSIQQSLRVPKDMNNSFAGFKYRNLEAIEERLKPLLKEHNLVLLFTDELVELAGSVYVKAIAELSDEKSKVQVCAYAKEIPTTAGTKMSYPQLTGSSSTYARKYAVSGMFLIDDSTDDPDSMEHQPKSAPKAQPVASSKPSEAQLAKITELAKELGIKEADIPAKVAKVTTRALAEATIKKMESDVFQIKVNGGND